MIKLIVNKDVMREVLSHIDDRELLKICSINKRCWNVICDYNFLKRRLSKYPDVEKYKEHNQKTYKNFFSRISFLISEMKRNYKFSYNLGNIIEQYDLLRSFGNNMNELLLLASEKGELSIVKYAAENEGDIHFSQDEPLFRACYYAHIEIVKYLLTTSTTEFYDEILRSICRIVEDKHLSIVKYFIETIENIDLDLPLGSACESGHVETIKYLIQKGANKFNPYVVRMANLYDAAHILQDL